MFLQDRFTISPAVFIRSHVRVYMMSQFLNDTLRRCRFESRSYSDRFAGREPWTMTIHWMSRRPRSAVLYWKMCWLIPPAKQFSVQWTARSLAVTGKQMAENKRRLGLDLPWHRLSLWSLWNYNLSVFLFHDDDDDDNDDDDDDISPFQLGLTLQADGEVSSCSWVSTTRIGERCHCTAQCMERTCKTKNSSLHTNFKKHRTSYRVCRCRNSRSSSCSNCADLEWRCYCER